MNGPISEVRYRSIVETTPDVVVIMDSVGIIVSANAATKSVLGYEPAEIVGKPLSFIMPERYRTQHAEGFRRYLSTGKRKLDWRSIELPALDKDKCEVPMSISFGEFEEDGRKFFTGILRDNTQAQKTREIFEFLARVGPALHSAQLDYHRTLAAVAQLVVPHLADWCAIDVLSGNGDLERIATAHVDPAKVSMAQELHAKYPMRMDTKFGVPVVLRTGKSELVEEIPAGFMEANLADPEQLRIVQSLGLRSYAIVPLTAFGTVHGALSLVQAESNRRFNESDLSFLEDLGRRAGLAVHDALLHRESLTANRKLEEQAEELEQQSEEAQALAEELEAQTQELIAASHDLEQKTTEAEGANKAKSEFLANMSHELRTPLNAIGGYVELLQMELRGPITPEQLADLERIKVASNHLLGLINDILNYAKVDAGKLEYRLESVTVERVIAEAHEMMAPQLEHRGIRYQISSCDAGLHALADGEKLRQILLNLFSNALKFTDEGGAIKVRCETDSAAVRIAVADTGMGIPADRIGEIFEPFIQVDRGLSRPGQGVGLGLAISRSLARGMNGDITVESEVGRGSTFVVQMPRDVSHPGTPPQ